jgi:hypothetical protein
MSTSLQTKNFVKISSNFRPKFVKIASISLQTKFRQFHFRQNFVNFWSKVRQNCVNFTSDKISSISLQTKFRQLFFRRNFVQISIKFCQTFGNFSSDEISLEKIPNGAEAPNSEPVNPASRFRLPKLPANAIRCPRPNPKKFLYQHFPILEWLPKYTLDDGISDLVRHPTVYTLWKPEVGTHILRYEVLDPDIKFGPRYEVLDPGMKFWTQVRSFKPRYEVWTQVWSLDLCKQVWRYDSLYPGMNFWTQVRSFGRQYESLDLVSTCLHLFADTTKLVSLSVELCLCM